MTTVELQS